MDGNRPLIEDESSFLGDWDDLRALRQPVDSSSLNRWIENIAIFLRKHGFTKVSSRAIGLNQYRVNGPNFLIAYYRLLLMQ